MRDVPPLVGAFDIGALTTFDEVTKVDILHQKKTGDARFDIDTGAVAEQALEGQQFAAVGREDLSSTLALLPPFIPPRSFLLSRM